MLYPFKIIDDVAVNKKRLHNSKKTSKGINRMDKEKTQKIVRDAYGKIAKSNEHCSCGTCGPDTKEFEKSIGYSEEELKVIPD